MRFQIDSGNESDGEGAEDGSGMNWPDVEHRLKSAVKLCEIQDTKAIIRLLLEVLMELWKGQ